MTGKVLVDRDGLTAEQWAEQLFEFEYCSECGGDVEDHDYILLDLGAYGSGYWFARCKNTGKGENENESDRN